MTRNRNQPIGDAAAATPATVAPATVAPATVAPATVAPATVAPAVAADPFAQFEVARNVTLPLLKQGEGEKVVIAFLSNIYRGRELKAARGGAERKKPADLAKVLNLLTGELQTYICATVLKSELTDNYPDNGYVGRAFLINRGPKKTGGAGAYNTYHVTEVKVPTHIKLPATETVNDQPVSEPAAPAAPAA